MTAQDSDKSALVTVGSTKFDGLIELMLTEPMLSALHGAGFSRLVIQCGNSEIPPEWSSMHKVLQGLSVNLMRFKPSLDEEVDAADLVISHAGSGTILEVLRRSKMMIVVPNDTLLDNHQSELAEALDHQGYLCLATLSSLPNVVRQVHERTFLPFPAPESYKFAQLVDVEAGYS